MNQQTKRNLLSLAGLAVLLVFAFGSEYSFNKNSNSGNGNGNGNSNSGVVHAKDTTTYTNSKSSFSGKLEDNYVAFSFDYPDSWKRDPKAGKGDDPNFVKVEKNSADNITIENFAVGYFTGQKEFMPQAANQISQQFSGSFPEYRKVSEGPTRLGSYDGYEFRFTSHTTNSGKEIDIWGRVILLPGDTNRKGAAIVLLATSASPDVHGVEDLGEKGELPIIVKSFRFGS